MICQHGNLGRQCLVCELTADLARVTSERDEAQNSRQQEHDLRVRFQGESESLRARVATLETDNARLREAVGGMMKMWEATVSLGYTRSPMRNAAYAAAEAAIKE